jgi:GT2 family glycosyltransferase
MSHPAPVTVGIPTYARGTRVFETLQRILACTPPPAEIIVHVDASDGSLEQQIAERFTGVHFLSSVKRIGPGGGRDRCLRAASQPYFASFDDDSWPLDADYFARVVTHFSHSTDIGGLAACISLGNEIAPPASPITRKVQDYPGCGHALRVDAYRNISGYVDRSVAYGLEEVDVSLQLSAAGWLLLNCADLRVFHDTTLVYQPRPDITAASIENAALLVWLRYPVSLWPLGMLQYTNTIRSMLISRGMAGIAAGIWRTPIELWRHRRLRRPLSSMAVRSYLRLRHRDGKRRSLNWSLPE